MKPSDDVAALASGFGSIPVAHGLAAHRAMPGSRFEVFPRAGHMPHRQDPDRLARLITEVCEASEPALLTADHWRPSQDASRSQR